MSIKIKNPKDRDEIFSQLQEMEEEKEQERLEMESWEIEKELDDYFISYPVDYCPECGDNMYIKGDVCLVCGYPKHYQEKVDNSIFDDDTYFNVYWF